jgi:hypothetical protein
MFMSIESTLELMLPKYVHNAEFIGFEQLMLVLMLLAVLLISLNLERKSDKLLSNADCVTTLDTSQLTLEFIEVT